MALEEIDSSDLGKKCTNAIKQCERIVQLCEDIPDAGEDFSESVREKTDDIRDWIESHRSVTQAQLDALDNMEEGARRWVH